MQHFALERLIMGVNAHARAEFALEYALQYMSERATFGKTINKYQALRHRFADLHADMEICKSYNYAVTQRLNSGDYVVKEATISKFVQLKWLMRLYMNVYNFWEAMVIWKNIQWLDYLEIVD